MAVSKDPYGREVALWGVQAQWPKWRAIKFTGAFERSNTDSTYTGLDPSPQFGGSYGETFAGESTQERWTPMDNPLSQSNALDSALGFSLRWGGGGLYTHGGAGRAPDEVADLGLIHSVIMACEWYMHPPLTSADTPRVPGLNLERRRTDATGMRLLGAVSSLWFGWGASSISSGDTEHTLEGTATAFTPIDFALGAIAASPFVFTKTMSNLTTYHPSAPDGPGYYPVRGTVLFEASATLTAEFLV